MFKYIWRFYLFLNKYGIIYLVNAPRRLFEDGDGEIDVQHYGTECLTKFPDVPPFDGLDCLDFFAFFFNASVDLTNKMEHGSITAVGVEFKVFYFIWFTWFTNCTIK